LPVGHQQKNKQMKKLVLCIIPILICGMTLIADNPKEINFVVELKPQKGFGPFRPIDQNTWRSEHPLIYTNVPKDIEEYVVRELMLDLAQYAWHQYLNNRWSKEHIDGFIKHFQIDTTELSNSITGRILGLVGTRGDKRVIIIDTDNDGDFGNEKILEYEYPLTDEKVGEARRSLPMVSAQFEYLENGQIKKREINIAPDPYRSLFVISHSDSSCKIEIKYELDFEIPEHRKGEMTINGADFDVFVSNFYSSVDYIHREHTFVFINPKSKPLLSQREGNVPHKIGDVFYVDGHAYLIDSISRFGSKLFIKHIGKNERATGVTEGFYLPDFTVEYLDGTIFDLEKYSDKYILFNFWGTWCVPCIAKIPELKKLNAEFSDNKNFVLVNVAFVTIVKKF
jgi:hypothetical protein